MKIAAHPKERPAKSITVDALAAFVPAIEAGARALRRQADVAARAFRMTDYQHHTEDAKTLDSLARHLDVRGGRR